jgi:hypothetical protein
MSLGLRILVACLWLFAVAGAQAQGSVPSDQQLWLSGQIGYANGNCVKASRYWFAYLLRKPAEMDATRQAQIEQLIRKCDLAPMQIAYADAKFLKKDPPKDVQCDQYADLAVAQFEAAQGSGCGFSGPRWSGNRAYHRDWCMGSKAREPDAELWARKGLMANCAPDR